jgi:hypothetical protein
MYVSHIPVFQWFEKLARSLNLNNAGRLAVELEAFNKAERKRDEGRGYSFSIWFGLMLLLSLRGYNI